jgi:hypothetical protein
MVQVNRIAFHDDVWIRGPKDKDFHVGRQKGGWTGISPSRRVKIPSFWCQINLVGDGRPSRLTVVLYDCSRGFPREQDRSEAELDAISPARPFDHFVDFGSPTLPAGIHRVEVYVNGRFQNGQSFFVRTTEAQALATVTDSGRLLKKLRWWCLRQFLQYSGNF